MPEQLLILSTWIWLSNHSRNPRNLFANAKVVHRTCSKRLLLRYCSRCRGVRNAYSMRKVFGSTAISLFASSSSFSCSQCRFPSQNFSPSPQPSLISCFRRCRCSRHPWSGRRIALIVLQMQIHRLVKPPRFELFCARLGVKDYLESRGDFVVR